MTQAKNDKHHKFQTKYSLRLTIDRHFEEGTQPRIETGIFEVRVMACVWKLFHSAPGIVASVSGMRRNANLRL